MAVITPPLKRCPACGKTYPTGEVCPDDGARLIDGDSVDPLTGKTLKNTFKIGERIAQGGMGIVYRATQEPIGRTVAVKAIFPHHSSEQEQTQRFFREAKLLGQVNHPNVVSLIDFGNTDDGIMYMVMEHLSGRTLDKVVPGNRGLPIEMVLDLMEQICAGVSAAHRIQMVHRDLKPANIFLANISGDSVMVKLLDFGIAKETGETPAQGLTQNGIMLGSCGYISPEQIQGGDVTIRSDVYALGGLLYFMLAGKAAYRGSNTASVLTKQVYEPPAAIDFEALGKPEGLELMPVIVKAMQPDPRRRYATVDEFLAALRKACGRGDSPTTSHRKAIVLPPGAAASDQDTVTPGANRTDAKKAVPTRKAAAQSPEEKKQRAENPRWVLAAGIGIAFVMAFGVFFALTYFNPPAGKDTAVKGKVTATSKGRGPLPTAPGVSENEVSLGMSAPFSGPARELGRGMKLGIDTCLESINDQGGIVGRRLRLIALDDGYEPARALPNMRKLKEEHNVFAIIGNVGTPTAEVTIPYALEQKLLFFGAFTGAKLLRKDPPDRYVFNYRASYAEETAAMVKYLVEIKKVKPEHIAVFAQQDGYGDAGFQGAVKALRKYGRDPEQVLRVGYARNTTAVEAAVQEVLKQRDTVRAIVMVPTYRAAARFIQQLRDAKLDAVFLNVSFVGSEALAEELKQLGGQYAEGVIVTQVVPHPESGASLVLKYREALAKYHPDEHPSFVSLEGFIAATLLGEGLKRTGETLNTENLVETLQGIQGLDLGLGAPINFGPSEHQGSHKVWGTVLDKSAKYRVIDLD
jgi:serine/threonine protein kinase